MRNIYLIMVLLFFSNIISAQNKDIEVNLSKSSQTKVRIEAASGNKYIGEHKLGKISFSRKETPEGSFIRLHGKAMFNTYFQGMPDLPVTTRLIEVPVGAEIHVKILSYDEEIIDLKEKGFSNKLYPAQESRSKADEKKEPEFRINKKVYNTDKYFKRQPVEVEDRGIMRYRRLAYLQISPFQYNPVKNKLKIINNLKFEISFREENTSRSEELKKKYRNPYFEGFAKNIIVNQPQKTTSNNSKEVVNSDPVTYVIVSDPSFKSQLQPFIDWKKKKGFNVIEGYTDVIGSTAPDIKSWLQDLYENPPSTPPSFVLFVGDVGQIPAWDGESDNHVTDLYYCEYTGDDLPDVYYGRFSAQNASQLQPQIDKTLQYEKYEMSETSYLKNNLLVAGVDADWAPTHGNGAINYATDYYINSENGVNPLTYLYDDNANSTVMASNASGASASIIEKINAGAGFANYTAHCNSNGWGDPSFTVSDVHNLTNANKYGLWIGNCCLSVKFDVDESFGEAALRAEEKGAIGDIGGSNNTLWDEDYFWGVGYTTSVTAHPTYEETELGAYDRLFHSHGESTADWYITQGQIPVAGNLAVEASSSTNKKYYWEIYHLMGDPSLMPYMGEPAPLTVSTSSPVLLKGMTSLTVNTEAYAYVALTLEGNIIDTETADESGVAELTFDPLTSVDTLDLVVTAQNREPYICTMEIIEANEPYVALDSVYNDDLSGDADGNADVGEEISMNVQLANYSKNYDALNVIDSLLTNDPFITLTDSIESFGQIDSSSKKLVNASFKYLISDSVPDQHSVEFIMKISGEDSLSNQYNWTSNYNMTINAPELKVGMMMIADTGGDGNGILDAGESGLLKVEVINDGHDSIGNVYGKLSIIEGPNLSVLSDSSGIFSIIEGESKIIIFPVSANESAPLEDTCDILIEVYGASRGQYRAEASKEIVISEIPRYYISEGGTTSTCDGYFYDSGGENGDYDNNENYTMTLKPNNPGNLIEVNFISFDVEENSDGGCYDVLNIYDGTSNESRLIGSYCNTSAPTRIKALNSDGALTFEFQSDQSVQDSGWVADITCVPADSLVFTVTDGTDSLSGASVKIGNTLVTTNSDGQAVFLRESGNYNYTITKTGYDKIQGELTVDGKTKKDVAMNLSEYDITFNVFDEEFGNSIEAEIILGGNAVHTSNGTYTFTGLHYETNIPYSVTADSGEFLVYEGTIDINSSKTVSVGLDAIEYGLDVTVVDDNDKAIEGASVVVDTVTALTDFEGKAEFLLRKGEYPCEISKTGYTKMVDTIRLNDTISQQMKIMKLYTVTFLVIDSISSESITGANIIVDTSNLKTGVDGYALIDLPQGDYSYSVNAEGFNDYSASLNLSNEITETIKLVPAATGFSDLKTQGIRVYPVPAEEMLTIQFEKSVKEFRVELIDLTGKIIIKDVASDVNQHSIDLKNAVPGVYILNLNLNGTSLTRRIIIN